MKRKRVLSVDVGGSKVKLLLSGETEPRKIGSGAKLTPARMVEKIRRETGDWDYDAVSIGVPARVGPAGLLAEPGNLGHGWVGFDFAAAFGCPVRIANDAAMQAPGGYDGGRMLFLGFGAGLGSALIAEHVIIALELGELPFRDASFSKALGRDVKTIPALQKAFMADYVMIGGGNAKHPREEVAGRRARGQ